MESPTTPFDGIFSLMLLLRRNHPQQDNCSRPHTSYGSSHNRSGSTSPPPPEVTCRPGHPADSFLRTERREKRRSKWTWGGRQTVHGDAIVVIDKQVPVISKRDRRSRLITSWNTPESDDYMSDRAHSRHTRAMNRKLPRIHEAELTLDDEECHNAELQRDGIYCPDDISAVKRTRALAALEHDLPFRRNSEGYDAVLVQSELGGGMSREGWDEAWSPL